VASISSQSSTRQPDIRDAMAEQGSRTLDREILSELRNATTRMAQGLTDLTSLQQTQTTANQDFQSSLDAINNTLQNPVGLQEISDALQVQSRPVLDSYNGRAPLLEAASITPGNLPCDYYLMFGDLE
jgi:hypothetical protein